MPNLAAVLRKNEQDHRHDNSGHVRCRELLTKNLRNFGSIQNYTEDEADAKMSRQFMSINLAKPIETVEQYLFVLCAWPSFADQPYINNYRIYDATGSARPPASPTAPTMSGTGFPSRSPMKSRC